MNCEPDWSRLVSPFFGDELSARNDQFELCLDLPPPFETALWYCRTSRTAQESSLRIEGALLTRDGRYDFGIGMRGSSSEESIRGEFSLKNHRAEMWARRGRIAGFGTGTQSQWPNWWSAIRSNRFPRCGGCWTMAPASASIETGFRVLPYGEPDDDWLRLDMRRVQNPTLRLSNNQVLGYVLISSEGNPKLRDQSNREGLIEGPPLDELRELVRLDPQRTRGPEIQGPTSNPPTPSPANRWPLCRPRLGNCP